MNDAQKNAVYISMMALGVLLSTIFVIVMTYYPRAFIVLFTLYVLGYSLFIFIIIQLLRKKDSALKDARWEVASFISLFNVVFNVAVLILFVFFLFIRQGMGGGVGMGRTIGNF